MTPEQLRVILDQIRNRIVLTVSVRSAEFYKNRNFLLENYLRIADKYPNLMFNIVAGSPDYSSVDSAIPLAKAFHNILTRVRALTTECVFLGGENLSSKLICKFIKNYGSIIPFLLYGDPRAVLSNHLPGPYAIYTPMAQLLPEEEAVRIVVKYLLRRKPILLELKQEKINPRILSAEWERLPQVAQRILRSRFQHYVLSSWNFKTRIETFMHYGARLIVGYPCVPDLLFELIRSLHYSSTPSSKSQDISETPLAWLFP
ncbi:MAG: hypothetical protein ACFFE8_01380 [Candidatus Heimdallarchaeota archaeon]